LEETENQTTQEKNGVEEVVHPAASDEGYVDACETLGTAAISFTPRHALLGASKFLSSTAVVATNATDLIEAATSGFAPPTVKSALSSSAEQVSDISYEPFAAILARAEQQKVPPPRTAPAAQDESSGEKENFASLTAKVEVLSAARAGDLLKIQELETKHESMIGRLSTMERVHRDRYDSAQEEERIAKWKDEA
jgi:hypothetical protein